MSSPRAHDEILVRPDFLAGLRAANKVLKPHGVVLKWRGDRRNLGDQVYLRAEKTDPWKAGGKTPAPLQNLKKPKVGDKIYVPTSMSIDHGEDDVQGGLATVSKVVEHVIGGKPAWFVEVRELPGIFNRRWSFDVLVERQEELKREYGKQKARPDPDPDPPAA